MSTPITCSELWEYRIQYKIFNHLDKVTKQTKSIRGPAFIALGGYSIIRSILLTASVAELTIRGLGLGLNPYHQASEERERGWILLKRVPGQIAELIIGCPIILIKDVISIISYPKHYIWENIEYIKVALPHAEANTIGSKDYKEDLYNAKLKF